MKLIARLARASVRELVRVACVLSLVGLAIIVFSIVYPRPLAVISAMSIGHGVGGAAFACYLLAVILDTASRERPTRESLRSAPPDADERDRA